MNGACVVVYGGVWWCVVVCGGVWWCVVVRGCLMVCVVCGVWCIDDCMVHA